VRLAQARSQLIHRGPLMRILTSRANNREANAETREAPSYEGTAWRSE